VGLDEVLIAVGGTSFRSICECAPVELACCGENVSFIWVSPHGRAANYPSDEHIHHKAEFL
jgi:hypothetical protein